MLRLFHFHWPKSGPSPIPKIQFRDLRSSKSRSSRGSFRNRSVNWTPEEAEANIIRQPTGQPTFAKPLLFTLAFSGASIVGASIWEYENLRARAMRQKKAFVDFFHTEAPKRFREFRLQQWWKELRDGEKIFYGILFYNALVFLAWRVPAFKPFLTNYFCSNPFARAVCWPMVLSTFSHYSLIHFGANMYVLYSFSSVTTQYLGKEQFLAFYLSAGVVSSFASHVAKSLMRQPGLSLGASGAIMGILGYFCTQNPDSRLAIVLIPNFTFTADTGLKALLAFDTLGLLLRWKLFDHAAHLGGALFGIFWWHWGQQAIWGRREKIMQAWHQIRSK